MGKSIISQPKQRAFLAAYARLGVLNAAATAAGVDRTCHFHWLKQPAYKLAFEAAKEEACEALEAEARRRAVEGVDEPVYQGGKKVGTIKKFSDVLLIFLMKGAMPEKYRERYEHRVGPIDEKQLDAEIEADLEELARRKAAGLPGPDQGAIEGGGVATEVLPALPVAEAARVLEPDGLP